MKQVKLVKNRLSPNLLAISLHICLKIILWLYRVWTCFKPIRCPPLRQLAQRFLWQWWELGDNGSFAPIWQMIVDLRLAHHI
jgi:hypothetical protein